VSVDASEQSSAPTVAVVGAGASGTLVAVQLLRRRHPRGIRVLLIERRRLTGRGVAYSTTNPDHRLNVPAAHMGALPRNPGHFLRWAQRRVPDVGPADFVPRKLYGEYLSDVLADAARTAPPGCALERVRDDAVDLQISPANDTVDIELRSGRVLSANRAVLALGNLPPTGPPGAGPDLLDSGRYEADPWADGLAERAGSDHVVLLLGTGLTMVDVALTLGAAESPGLIRAVSRKGLVPRRHRRGVRSLGRRVRVLPDQVRLGDLVASVEAEISETEDAGGDWREVIDSLRPDTNQIWRRLSDGDRRRFVERLARRWDVHRHRMAPEVADKVDRLRARGRLVVSRGAVKRLRPDGDSIEVLLEEPGSPTSVVHVDRVVNCTGPALDLANCGEQLLRAAFERGYVREGPLHLGLDHDARGALVGRDGVASGLLYTLGPLRKGRLWETTAIPEIRFQALELADQLACALERNPTRAAMAA